MQIEIEVTGQKIKRLNSPGSVADTLNYLTCHSPDQLRIHSTI